MPRNRDGVRSLQGQLDRYTATAARGSEPGSVAAEEKHGRQGWRAFAAAIGSGLALATSAEAQIIYSGPINATAPANGGSATAKGNFFGAGVGFGIFAEGGVGDGYRGAAVGLNGATGGVRFLGNTDSVKRLGAGSKISAGAGNFNSFGFAATAFGSSNGPPFGFFGQFFPLPATGFVGVSFNTVPGGQRDFGWIQLQVTDNNTGSGYPYSITAVNWAYNSSGGPINAGSQPNSNVPEPASAALWLLAAGSLGVLAWRERRQKAAADLKVL